MFMFINSQMNLVMYLLYIYYQGIMSFITNAENFKKKIKLKKTIPLKPYKSLSCLL